MNNQTYNNTPRNLSLTARALITAAVACMTLPAGAQLFNHVVGSNNHETANGMCHTRDGGWATVGSTTMVESPNPHRDILVVKYSQDGRVEWANRYGRERDDVGYSIRATPDDGYIIAAESESFDPAFNLLALKLDNTGNFQWANMYSTTSSNGDIIHRRDGGAAVRLAGEEGFVLTSRVREGELRQDGVLVLVRRDGQPLFQQRYFDPFQEDTSCITFSDVTTVNEGNFVVSGSLLQVFDSGQVNIDPLLMQIRSDGAPILATNYQYFVGNIDQSTGDGLDVDPETQEIFLDGRTDLGSPGFQAMYLSRIDTNLFTVWMQAHRRMGTSYRTVRYDHNRQVTVAGWRGNYPSSSKSMIASFDAAGGFIFGMEYNYVNIAKAMFESPTNSVPGYALAGTVNLTSSPGFGGEDIQLIHTDNNGRTICLESSFESPPGSVAIENPIWEPRSRDIEVQRVEVPMERLELSVASLCDTAPPCPICAADYNQDGGVDGSDVGDFFNDWAASAPCADVNNDGGVDGSDVGAFFDVWAAGGCL